MFLQKILVPDKSNFIIKLYHKSNKLLLPLLGLSIILDDDNIYKKYIDYSNLLNINFHSFISFSSIITDYHKKIFINEKILRLLNVNIHSIVLIYFSKNLIDKYYNPQIYNFNKLKRRETIPFE